jgi:indole-3-glycerol phosphate synthase
VQASRHWQPPAGTLGALVDRAYDRARGLDPVVPKMRETASGLAAPVPFAEAVRRDDVAIIAEVKRRSPSKGDINVAINAGAQAAAYVEGGASALSVLTEPEQFGGSAEDLKEVHARVSIPLLRKDFIVDYAQILEARTLGASAVLLIVRALDPVDLADRIEETVAFGLTPLVEVHNEAELELAISQGATVIGVNNRNLETLEVDPENSARLIREIPPEIVAIAESGISTREDVERQAAAGADAVLVGSVLSAAPDPAAAVRALIGVPRQWRS